MAGRFGERTGWKLRTQHAIDAAQCFTGPRVCYVADNLGTVWRFLDPDPATGKLEWRRVGSIGQSTTATYGTNWVFHVNPGRTRAYLLTKRGKFFEMRLSDGRILRNLDFPAVEPAFAGWWYYGHNAWDQFGRFYLAAFKQLAKSTGVRLLAVDPVSASSRQLRPAADQASSLPPEQLLLPVQPQRSEQVRPLRQLAAVEAVAAAGGLEASAKGPAPCTAAERGVVELGTWRDEGRAVKRGDAARFSRDLPVPVGRNITEIHLPASLLPWRITCRLGNPRTAMNNRPQRQLKY